MDHYKIIIRELVWDKINVEHIKKHELSVTEIEGALKDDSRLYLKGHSGRDVVLCKIGNRMLALVLGKESEGKYYVVTARDMCKKERTIYREGKN